MDLKALMQKLETINTKQIVTESVETKKVITESVARRVVKESADPVFTSSIARGLVEEFGYEVDERVTPDGKGGFTGGLTPQPAAAPAAAAGFTPEQQAKMGKANPQDPYIVARVLGKDAVPLSHFTDPEDQAIAKRMGFKDGPAATAPGAAPAGGLKRGGTAAPTPTGAAANPMQQDPAQAAAAAQTGAAANPMQQDPAAQASRIADRMDAEAGASGAGQTPTAAAPEQGEKAATKPAAADPAVAATREKFKALMDKLEKTGGVSGSAPAPAAPTAPKKPTQIAPQPKPAPGAGTKPSQALPGTTGVPGAQISDTPAAESVSFEDDKTLLAIKNIRY